MPPPPGYVELLSLFNDLCGCSIIILLFWRTIMTYKYILFVLNTTTRIVRICVCVCLCDDELYSTGCLRYESQKGQGAVSVQQLWTTTAAYNFLQHLFHCILTRNPIHPSPRLSRYFSVDEPWHP